MTRRATSEGLRIVVDGERAEAADWRRLKSDPGPDSKAALFKRYREVARRTALREHGRISGMGLELSDCSQAAYEALLDSIDRYDPARGIPFPAFVRPRIVGAIRNALAKATEARSAFNARKRAERDRLASLKRKAARHADDDAMEALREVVVGMALGFMLEENGDAEAENVASEAPSAFDGAAWSQLVRALDDKLANLPEKERSVLDFHYKQGLQFAEIATLLGLSRGRISQIHAQALARLRKSLAKFR